MRVNHNRRRRFRQTFHSRHRIHLRHHDRTTLRRAALGHGVNLVDGTDVGKHGIHDHANNHQQCSDDDEQGDDGNGDVALGRKHEDAEYQHHQPTQQQRRLHHIELKHGVGLIPLVETKCSEER